MNTYIIIIISILILIILYLIYVWFFKKKTDTKIIDASPVIQEVEDESRELFVNNELKNPYFIVSIDGVEQGKVTFELFDEIVPKTCANFRHLCSKGLGGKKEACYKNSIFHRVIPEFMIQGGDFTNFDGTGGKSIYGDKFDDENFELKHNQPGLLSMANSGPNTNGSQFFITLKETPWLDDKHVVFGILMGGFETIKKIELLEQDENNKPKVEVKIIACGLE
jgi:cyclophilin family peptidyl-prolyl cis-trans isomerase